MFQLRTAREFGNVQCAADDVDLLNLDGTSRREFDNSSTGVPTADQLRVNHLAAKNLHQAKLAAAHHVLNVLVDSKGHYLV